MTSTRSAKKKTKNAEVSDNGPVMNVIDQNTHENRDEENVINEEQSNGSENTNTDGSPTSPSGPKDKNANSPEITRLENSLPQSGLLTPSGAKSKNKNLSFTEPAHKRGAKKFAASMSLFQDENISNDLEKPGANTRKKKVIHVNEIWEKSGDEQEMFSPPRRKKMSSKRRLVVVDEEGSDPEFEDFKGR